MRYGSKNIMRNFLLLGALATLFSCSNELEINAPYKDVTVVYGLIEANQDTNWVRIHKTYLGNEGINGGSQNPDSIYYKDIEVSIEEVDAASGIVHGRWPLVLDSTTFQMEPGFFTVDGFRLYRFDHTINDTRSYRIIIEKPDGEGETVEAITPVVKNFNVTRPSGIQRITFGRTGQDFEWQEAVNARIYQSFLRFYYVEVNKDRMADSTQKFVDYQLPNRYGTTLNGGKEMTVNVSYDQFYRFLSNAIEPTTDKNRFFRGMDIYVTAGADDLTTYINVSQPATGVVQDKPFYSNVSNGAGIFSSRNEAERLRAQFSNASIDSLVKGIYTCGLRFAKPVAADTCLCDRSALSGFDCD
jgi:hypothetical protein